MAGAAVRWAWEQDLPAPTKLVLLALADAVGGRSGEEWRCWPSQDTLAQRCGISERQVRTHIAALVDAGLILATHRPGDGSGRKTTVYTLRAPQMSLALPVDKPVDKSRATGSALPLAKGGQPEVEEGATGSRLPPMDKRNHPTKREATATPDNGARSSLPARAIALSLCAFDWKGQGEAARPDLEPDLIAESWQKFATRHLGESKTPDEWARRWRLWCAREWKNHPGRSSIAARDRPTEAGSAAHLPAEIPKAEPLTDESKATARVFLLEARQALKRGARTQ